MFISSFVIEFELTNILECFGGCKCLFPALLLNLSLEISWNALQYVSVYFQLSD